MCMTIACVSVVFSGCSDKDVQSVNQGFQNDQMTQTQAEIGELTQGDYKTESEMVAQKKDFLQRLFDGDFFVDREDPVRESPEQKVDEVVVSPTPVQEIGVADPLVVKRAEVFGGVVCAAVDKDFWQSYFDDGTVADREVLLELQKKRDAYFVDQGYATEYDALIDLEESRKDVQFQKIVQEVVNVECGSAFIASETLFDELFEDPFVE